MIPLVTIALPTYRRPQQLRHAIESVVAQDYPEIELIVSDNASEDGTRAVCSEYTARYPWIRYVAHDRNIGPTANFESLRHLARGAYFMFLGDDDWIDPALVRRCVDFHETHPGYALVSGRVLYHRPDGAEPDLHPVTLEGDDAVERVLDYCRKVLANGVFYGVVPRRVDGEVPPLRNVQGGDLLRVMGLAFLGKVRTVDEVVVHRRVGGATTSLANVAVTMRLSWFERNAPQLAIAYFFFRDIAIDSPVYAPLGRVGRTVLALRATWIVTVRFVPGAFVKFARLAVATIRRRVADRTAQLNRRATHG